VLRNEAIRAAAPPPYNNVTAYPYYRMERPKLFKCPGTGKYVMWFHCDTSGFAMKSVGVLTADAVTGPFSFASQCFRPDGADSYDMGTFYDDPAMTGGDGHMYLVRSVFNSYAGASIVVVPGSARRGANSSCDNHPSPSPRAHLPSSLAVLAGQASRA
jgi:hypothetical protein